ncbi:MAG: YbaK/EbsC family protein [Paracoccaceae bacterium]|nr:YbaK/EbsC family protein [Paracoccaceae bacterium]
MTIATKLKQHLEDAGVPYNTVAHPRTISAMESAEAAHVPGDSVAKTVVIHLEDGYVLAVVPSSHRVDLTTLQELLDRRLGLASEREIDKLFDDCDSGAIPPVGSAYGLPTVLDASLRGRSAIWFEGGDHRTLVNVSGADFERLMQGARQESFSHHV